MTDLEQLLPRDYVYGWYWRQRSLAGLPIKRCPSCEGRGIVVAMGYFAEAFDLPHQRLARPGTWCLPCDGRGLIPC